MKGKIVMREHKRKIAVLVMTTVFFCILFTACGNSAGDDPVAGTWELTKVSAAGKDMTAAEFINATNSTDLQIPTLIFNGDNTVEVDMLGSKGTGKWEVKDGMYHISDGSSMSLDFKLEDEVLSVEYMGAALEFSKK